MFNGARWELFGPIIENSGPSGKHNRIAPRPKRQDRTREYFAPAKVGAEFLHRIRTRSFRRSTKVRPVLGT